MNKLSIKELMKNRKKKGFTLIELIIVIAIIAILAAMAIPKFGTIKRDANIKTDVATAKNIATAAATIMAESDNNVTEISMDDVKKKLDGDTTPKAESGKFSVEITDEGNIEVFVGDKQVYPNTAANYGKN